MQISMCKWIKHLLRIKSQSKRLIKLSFISMVINVLCCFYAKFHLTAVVLRNGHVIWNPLYTLKEFETAS